MIDCIQAATASAEATKSAEATVTKTAEAVAEAKAMECADCHRSEKLGTWHEMIKDATSQLHVVPS